MLDGNYYIAFDNSDFRLYGRYCTSRPNTRRGIFKAVVCYTGMMFTRTQFWVTLVPHVLLARYVTANVLGTVVTKNYEYMPIVLAMSVFFLTEYKSSRKFW